MFHSIAGVHNNKYFRGGVNFKFQNAFHFGNSANLAISALWFTQLLEASNHREKFRIHSHSVITGNVDKEGNVLPVDEETIGLKIQAVFFSWAKILAVPANQRDLFDDKLAELREKYPNRQIVLYGVKHLRELFFDRRLSTHIKEGRLKYYSKKVKSQEYRAITAPMIIVLLGIISWLIFGPVDQNPVEGEFNGSHLILKNQYGQRITSLEVGIEVARLEEGIDKMNNKFGFFDLNEDGTNEVIFARDQEVSDGTNGEQLVVYSTSGDSVVWSRDLIFNLEFPNKTFSEDLYRLHSVNYIERSAKSAPFLIANVGHRNFFPSMILKMNPDNGDELGRYVHTGRVRQTLVEDIDNDGVEEVLGLGQNNAFEEITVFFALEAEQIEGHSPITEEYMVSEYQPAGEKHYIGIPRTIVGDAFSRRLMNNSPSTLFINKEEKRIRVRVYDLLLPDNNPFEVNTAELIFIFDYNFRLQSIGTHSYYDLWAKNLYEDGMIPFEPDHEYFEAFKDSLFYWDGEGFTNTYN